MFWMMVVARGVAGFGAGCEYPVCTTNATEAADETVYLRRKRGFPVASTTDLAVDHAIINLFYLPGCLIGGLLMYRIGRKQTMTLGFVLWAIWGFILGGTLQPVQSILPLFVMMYGIFNVLGEMGPGISTFLCAAESFPTPLRGHFLGLAAAVGKAGGSIGTEDDTNYRT
ncbi:hypothetical protein BO86DRAFT_399463 [Aspergillus japonicus CBS 114.51]|uniref:Major facilitator superfamily (MFS) profile domain-containing protein n=2 Tax=Aspergillus TaxID=5052 RepID=A0A2V5GRU6_ASPV1|nr:hypothetical protein BO86DRAFT_399463 [Aspergillus japonicus CBS 114.51]PYI13748.1 hypothetical protein BO99DRAFT_437994 [Aspergillus violaceofuscus CBS 115571]RAH81932.1 hypothetical protein BO86DRAFT_399463 [Aspergillus japonicus CBS 114.51]